MKKLFCTILLVILSCDSEDVLDCFQTAGNIITQTMETPNFERVLVNRGIELIVKQDSNYTVSIETGENLLNDIEVKVVDERLILTDNNNCNFVRDYGVTKIVITSPNLTEIRSSSQYDVSSEGVISYEQLTLISEDFNNASEFAVGDFRFEVDMENLRTVANNLSFFYIEGQVDNLYIGFFAGASRFEGENLMAQNISVYHRGSNDMIVNPQLSLTGILRGTGDLISVSQPPVVDIEEIYIGELIFN